MILYSKPLIRVLALSCIVVIAALACGGDDDGGATPDGDNILTNGGFEDGAEGWTGRSGEAAVSDAEAKDGSNSLDVTFAVTADTPASGAEFAYQQTQAGEVPEFMSFDYYVADWVRGIDAQYIEAVVIITGSGVGMPDCPGGEPCPNIQMRYVLAGVTAEPTQVLNARWRFIGEEEPATGEWLHFETDVRNDLTEEWGSLPSVIDSIKLQLEVRYDGRLADETDGAATVYWDNVYLGPR